MNAVTPVNMPAPETPEKVLPAPPPELVITDPEQLKALGDALRLELLEVMGRRARHAWSVKELAEVTGQPKTKLYHHVNLLEARGLLRVASTQLVSGIVERRYQVAAQTFRVKRSLLTGTDGQAAIGQLLDVTLDDTRSQIMASVASGRIDPSDERPGHRLLIARNRLRLRPNQVEALTARLEELLAEGAWDGGDGPDTVTHGLLVAFYPVADERSSEP